MRKKEQEKEEEEIEIGKPRSNCEMFVKATMRGGNLFEVEHYFSVIYTN